LLNVADGPPSEVNPNVPGENYFSGPADMSERAAMIARKLFSIG